MTKVKICGITNLEDAQLSVKFGADALGFNFYRKSPRYIEAEKVREIVEKLSKDVLKVGVFVNETVENIIEIAKIAKLDAIQLHGEETPEFATELKQKTNLEIIKAFRVSPEFKHEDVLQYQVDAILLDAYNPKEHGGTGETFDWEIAKKVQEIFPKMYLAGGLNSKNITLAIENVNPLAVDVCSSVEKTKRKKDDYKIYEFIGKVRHHKFERIFPPKNIYDLLLFIENRPSPFLGEKSLIGLSFFLLGYGTAMRQHGKNFDYQNFLDFEHWIAQKYNEKFALGLWHKWILHQSNNDEEKAFDLFFALLEEFKLEHEDLDEN
jgi:phosphoribosylanthranilate isomerase